MEEQERKAQEIIKKVRIELKKAKEQEAARIEEEHNGFLIELAIAVLKEMKTNPALEDMIISQVKIKQEALLGLGVQKEELPF
ncbi:hypothetical protein [Thiomicrorhabdus aquaedulcis]|uniref:hypothetical protein n=1 Tax=Thiomicrorhabdus aquaedulcis TaxID=2211106 RepID=UPI000FD8CC18|nr:hypothetical protein [Thiomicrorhabdus aquaedulcis]